MNGPPDQAPSDLNPDEKRLVEQMLDAYRQGWFPMAEPDSGEVYWFNPPTRAIIPLEPGAFRVPRSLAQRVRSGRFRITTDCAFERVIRECSRPRPKPGGEPWIDERIIRAYSTLHRAGVAHSVEAWLDGDDGLTLVGGLYGVTIGGLFAGESMFSRPELGGTDASKVCLVHLVDHLRRRGFVLLDTQIINPHTEQFGCIEIQRDEYLERLRFAVGRECAWQPRTEVPVEENFGPGVGKLGS